jgi:hypothetical protein
MQLAGDEKRIQALFCELARDEQNAAPRFEKLWSRVETTKAEPARSFNRSVALIAAALVITAICSLALWLQFRSVKSAQSVAKNSELISIPSKQNLALSAAQKRRRFKRQNRIKRPVAQRSVEFSSWQSPTGIFMQPPANAVVKSLPQLNESARKLESFLPNSEVKELNQ